MGIWASPIVPVAAILSSLLALVPFEKWNDIVVLAACMLRLERYREDWDGPCARVTHIFMKRSIFCAVPVSWEEICIKAQCMARNSKIMTFHYKNIHVRQSMK